MKKIIAHLSVFLVVVLSVASTVSAVTNEAKIVASDGAANDEFGGGSSGNAVAISGDFAIVGTSLSRAVYIFRYDGGKWSEQQILTASDAPPDYWTNFGCSVSISRNNAIVGACYGDGKVANTGAAYIYNYNGTSWVEQQKLIASDGELRDYYGLSVSISGDYVIVGARHADSDVLSTGAAYIYHYDGTSWVEVQKLIGSDTYSGDFFGNMVMISGDYAIVGAPTDDDDGTESGSAYIFRFDGANWVEQQKLTASDATFLDRFGWSVSISGDKAIVGALNGDGEVKDEGAAYIFHYDGANWVEQQKFLAQEGISGGEFGAQVSISGDNAIVGSQMEDETWGVAYLYHYDGRRWNETARLEPIQNGINIWGGDLFGSSVSIADNKAIVGARGDDDNGSASGSAYIYAVDSTDPVIVDKDNDGYISTDDCNDRDASINPESSEICDDGVDNNCDGLIDSQDSNCEPISKVVAGREKGKKCYDGIDNDDDGLLDFTDPDCFKNEGKGKTCSDGLDNDGDQLIDCDDSDCLTNRACEGIHPTLADKPDLVVTDIIQDGPNYLRVKYMNIGTAGDGDFLIKVSAGGKIFGGNPYYRFPVPPPGEEIVTGGFTIGLIGLSSGSVADVTAEIDWEHRVDEQNEHNNYLTKHIKIM